jgi:ATP-dependent Clp protease ATP-binding subunit ClpC
MAVTEAQFTAAARGALLAAVEEAARGGQPYLGTAHLLLGLARQGVTARALAALGAPLPALRREVARAGPGVAVPLVVDRGAPVLTPGARAALERAVAAAARRGHPAASPEDVLLALVGQGPSFAAHVLGRLGLAPDDVRAALPSLSGRDADLRTP